jgi:putative peptidoglycan lipid II flippase
MLLTLLGALAAAILVSLSAPLIVLALAPGLSAEGRRLCIDLTRTISPSLVFLIAGSLLEGLLLASRRFLLLSLATFLVNVGLVAGLLAPGPLPGVINAGLGLDAGAILEVAILGWVLRASWRRPLPAPGASHVELAVKPHPTNPRLLLAPFWRQLLPLLVWMGLAQLNQLVDRIFASTLGAGKIALIGYAATLVLLLPNILGTSVLSAATSTFSEQAARGDWVSFKRTFNRSVRMVLFLTLPLSLGLLVAARPLVQLLFERGSFDSGAVLRTSWAAICYSPTLAVSALAGVLVGVFFILRQGQKIVYLTLLTLGLNVLLNATLIRVLDYAGIPVATSTYSIIRLILLLMLLPRPLAEAKGGRIWPSLLKISVAAAGMLAIIWMVGRVLQATGGSVYLDRNPLAAVLILVLTGAATYLGIATMLGLREISRLRGLIRTRVGLGQA